MHACDLLELAAIVSAHGPQLIQSGQRVPAGAAEQYWTASKVRLDRWGRSLKEGPEKNLDVLEEILISEVLTRVWTAVLCGYDRRHGTDEVEPVARSVLIGHMEARHRVLTLMVGQRGINAAAAMKLNRLRRRAERWTDMLLARLAGACPIAEFAADPQRARDFADDARCRGGRPFGRQAWPLVMMSLRAAFRRSVSPNSPNADLNGRIAAAILSFFPPEVFDSTGLLRSLWMMRLSNITDDTQGMIEELLAVEPTAPTRGPGFASDLRGQWWQRLGG